MNEYSFDREQSTIPLQSITECFLFMFKILIKAHHQKYGS